MQEAFDDPELALLHRLQATQQVYQQNILKSGRSAPVTYAGYDASRGMPVIFQEGELSAIGRIITNADIPVGSPVRAIGRGLKGSIDAMPRTKTVPVPSVEQQLEVIAVPILFWKQNGTNRELWLGGDREPVRLLESYSGACPTSGTWEQLNQPGREPLSEFYLNVNACSATGGYTVNNYNGDRGGLPALVYVQTAFLMPGTYEFSIAGSIELSGVFGNTVATATVGLNVAASPPPFATVRADFMNPSRIFTHDQTRVSHVVTQSGTYQFLVGIEFGQIPFFGANFDAQASLEFKIKAYESPYLSAFEEMRFVGVRQPTSFVYFVDELPTETIAPDPIAPLEEDWRKSLATYGQPTPAEDLCIGDYRFNREVNLYDEAWFRVDLAQQIDGQPLSALLTTATEPIAAQIQRRTATPSDNACTLGDLETIEAEIQPLGEGANIIAAAPIVYTS